MGHHASRLFGLSPGAAVLLAVALVNGTAWAGEVEVLQQQVDRLEAELGRLKEQLNEVRRAQQEAARAQAARNAAPEKTADGKAVRVTTKPGIAVETEDGAFSAQIGGRIMVDSAWYGDDKSKLGDGTELRRARILVKGTLLTDWDYKVEVDFSGNDVSLKDVYIAYAGFDPAVFTLGNFKIPFSLEGQTSSKYITFMERALSFAFVPGRKIGIGGWTHGDNWSAGAGLFGDAVGGDVDSEGNEAWHAGGRVTYAPLSGKTRSLHLGFGAVYGDPNNDTLGFLERPESHVTDVRFVTTGTIMGARAFYIVRPEVAAVLGPFAFQGEYTHTGVTRDRFDDVDFDGWYAEASYFLTGESRPFNPKRGNFGRLRPKASLGDGGLGAWQIAARYSTIDLTDEDILGGEEINVTLGLNWYLNPYVRLMLNTIWVDTDRNATGNAANTSSGETPGDDDPFIVQVRGQIDF